MRYNLFLDDCRKPKDVTWVELPLVEWVVVKNYKEFVNTILQRGVPAVVSFDHDLADEHYVKYFEKEASIDYNQFKEKTGYDCAKWLANYCVDNNVPIPLYYIHTLNPVGLMNIHFMLESARKVINLKPNES